MNLSLGQNINGISSATAVAHANIALVKYWGKRAIGGNLPAVGSISLTLDALKTETTVTFDSNLKEDSFDLNNANVTGIPLKRVSKFLDSIAGNSRPYASIISENNFPTAAGLASSASGFAALALSATNALDLKPNSKELSKIARTGSGSAARSIYGGFVEMNRGNSNNDDAEDFAINLYDQNYWDVRMLIAVTSTEEKATGSTEGMNRTATTSPFYEQWVNSQQADLKEMKMALQNKDFEKAGEITEHSCFKMHGLAMSARPPLLYWNATTIETIQIIKGLRKKGVPAYITMDAGPQVKVFCLPEAVESVKNALSTINGIKGIIECRPGPAAEIKSLANVY